MQGLGLAEGGACDMHAYSWANYLLGNSKGCASLEVTLGPFIAEFSNDTVIALCGAEVICFINERKVCNWSTHKVVRGDQIKIFPSNRGLRSYLAIKDGFHTPKQFGFYTEVPKESFASRIVVDGALLPYEPFTAQQWIEKSVPSRYVRDYRSDLTLNVMPCYQFDFFSNEAKAIFIQSEYTVTQNCDRMGYRLSGRSLEWCGGDVISEGIAFGSVQVPPDGQPIVLLNDRQTIGGYPKLGCVLKQDCYRLAQRQAGQKVTFQFVQA